MRILWALGVLGAAGVALGLALLLGSSGRPGSPGAGGGTPAGDRGRLLPPATPLSSYRVTYRVTFSGGNTVDEEVTVGRPHLGMDVTRRDGAVVSGEVSNAAGLWVFSNPSSGTPGWSLLEPGLHRAVSDVQPVAAINRAVREGKATVGGTSTVAGRTCRLVVTGQPVGQPLGAPSASSRVTLCIDATGIPLSESWRLNGRSAIEEVATSFDPGFSPTAGTFSPTPVIPVAAPATVVPLDPSRAAGLVPPPDPPPGYRLEAGLILVSTSPVTGMPTSATKVFFTGPGPGAQLVELDYQEGSVTPQGAVVDLGGGHRGYLALGYSTCSLSFDTASGASVVAYSPDPAVLEAAGRRWVAALGGR